MFVVELELGGWATRSAATAGAAELAGMLGGWVIRSTAIAGAAELAGMLVVELELGGWSPGRRRSPARPSSPACSWSSSTSLGWPPGRRRRRRSGLAGMLVAELELSWFPGSGRDVTYCSLRPDRCVS